MINLKKTVLIINTKLNETFSPKGKKIFLALLCIGFVTIIYIVSSFLVPPKQASEKDVLPETAENVAQDNAQNVEVSELDLTNVVQPEDKMVSLSSDNVGRADPFNPTIAMAKVNEADLIAPPTSLSVDESASKMFSTKVSGIMYDVANPSAILNVEGTDYFVKAGDYISGYKILSIRKDFVTLKSGKNVYRVGVGQLVSNGAILANSDSNLRNKFGGARR